MIKDGVLRCDVMRCKGKENTIPIPKNFRTKTYMPAWTADFEILEERCKKVYFVSGVRGPSCRVEIIEIGP